MGRPLRRREARLRQDRQVLLLPRLVGGRRAAASSDQSRQMERAAQDLSGDDTSLRAREAGAWMTTKYDVLNPQAVKRLVASGAELRPFPQPVMEACYNTANEI